MHGCISVHNVIILCMGMHFCISAGIARMSVFSNIQ